MWFVWFGFILFRIFLGLYVCVFVSVQTVNFCSVIFVIYFMHGITRKLSSFFIYLLHNGALRDDSVLLRLKTLETHFMISIHLFA